MTFMLNYILLNTLLGMMKLLDGISALLNKKIETGYYRYNHVLALTQWFALYVE